MNVIAFFAHPDDETMLCGGTLALLAQNNVKIHLICATHGEGGENGEPPLCHPDELGNFREQELRCAARELNCHQTHILNYIDPKVSPDGTLHPYTEELEELSLTLMTYIQKIKPIALISHGSNGEYGHPAHRLSHQAALISAQKSQIPILFYTVQAIFPQHPKPRLANKNDQAHIIIDVSSVLEQKTNAAYCHKTQHALFIRNASREANRKLTIPDVITTIESLHRVFPVFNEKLDDPIAAIFNNLH